MMEFADFFKAVHGQDKPGFEPFPWQQTLAEQVAETGQWPAVIDLPTASGKTAILDIAVWHLAQQAELPPHQRTAPRRIWFVVDRRIVVDEAYQRARLIAHWLGQHCDSAIAKALYQVSGLGEAGESVPPLSYGRLRGGILQDSGWASFPSQPAIITSTVDQFGSRLLFRGYGMGPAMWPVHAALAGNDSLLVLDEAHLAQPLMQTLRWVQHYRDDLDHDGAPPANAPRWCEQKINLPWQMTVMSATPPSTTKGRFPSSRQQRATALDHPLLQKRITASKPARLVTVDVPKGGKNRPPTACASEAAVQATQLLADGRQRIAVMMNRVDAAMDAYEQLRKQTDIDTILLTGRMRPYDRDTLVNEWQPGKGKHQDHQKGLTYWLGAKAKPPALARPIVLVTTQCLEVGADLSFDALVTECASVDALRQRFGRLNRLGVPEWDLAPAAILAWHGDIDGSRIDPIYHEALARTWVWLNEQSKDATVDFGIASLDEMLEKTDTSQLEAMLPPRPDAPVLLPAYLDAWSQTGPTTHIEASPSLFLHGPAAGQAEVQVAFRRDLTEALPDDQWQRVAQLTTPVSGELLTVKAHRLQQWLRGDAVATESDVEGVSTDGKRQATDVPPDRWVHYRGRGAATQTSANPDDIRPGDILIFPAGERIASILGHGDECSGVDIYEQAVAHSGRPQTFRLTRALLDQWYAEHSQVGMPPIYDWLNPDDQMLPDIGEWADVKEALHSLIPADLHDALNALGKRPRLAPYPGGVLLIGLSRLGQSDQNEVDPFADEQDSYSLIGKAVSLETHSEQVAKLALASARCCVPDFAEALEQAARLHDLGKDEPRFQALLHNQAVPRFTSAPLAKSQSQASPTDRLLRAKLGINRFRHEMLSMQRASVEHGDNDLLLHLIASHHGHARPFAPVFDDDIWNGTPPHHIGSGVADRFWKLNRRYGWWGLAYLEAILRLADHHASRFPRGTESEIKDD